MANTFKNDEKTLTTGLQQVYICPASKTAIVLLAQATNIGSGAQAVSLCWYDYDASNKKTELVKALSVPAAAAVGLISGKMVLEAGDYMSASAANGSAIDLTISVLEIDV